MNFSQNLIKVLKITRTQKKFLHLKVDTSLPKARYGGKQTITLLTGDGVGPEILNYVKQVIHEVKAPVDFQEIVINRDSDNNVFDDAVCSIKRNGVAIKGNLETREDQARSGSESKNLRIRTTLDLFAYVQKCQSVKEIKTRHKNVDLVIIRENTEGEYSSLEHESVPGIVESLKIITSMKSERIARFAFDFAVKENRRKVTAVHKANIMKLSDGLFIDKCTEVAKEYPKIKFETMIVDNCSMQMVSRPDQFDVMVMPNLYGNIIGNIGAGIVGGSGMCTGMNIGHDCAVFESGTRNSGRNLTGKNVANPCSLLLSSCDMLDYLGYSHYGDVIRKAIFKAIGPMQIRTPDIGGTNTTSDIVDAVIKEIKL